MALDLNNKADRKQAYRDLTWGDHGFLRRRFANHHDIGGGMYRENQPSPKRVAEWTKMGIKTNINLRGESPKGFYLLEKEACEKHGITMIDFRVYSRDTHTPEKIRGAKELFESIEYPAVMHCKSGADRTGIMGVLYRHFHMGDTIEKAMEQLKFKYLHVKQGKTGMLDFFFKDYLKYSKTHDIEFIEWVETVYDPADVKARFMEQWSGNPVTELLLRRE
ncbi:fused DSP-PTPase phosphatase/NAD kinase-like protein [Hellea balneolensis]|uniref:fused DSP-PTPase phosphatase/NAD kinase-like protein n=1 Tax=Hellea balneolensis TaxID=287478 RepID=UPI0003F5ADBE|nr:protein-tyrosine-phosphatase [Hellea balneolensis]